ncbi:MAG: TetR/AcrR family transcriptional regulator [Lachnospiraceae bacterium]|nr:TetR/AcrR family transcriptional regulator [Lachnospiraceae bacterium]
MKKEKRTILEEKNVLRLNNEESNKLTRECLTAALMQLMKEKPLDKITITELVARSGVSRTAFYRNYSTKEDILVDIRNAITETSNNLLLRPELKDDPFLWFKECFRIVQDNADLIRPILDAKITLADFFKNQSVLDLLYPNNNRMNRYKNLAIEAAFQRIIIVWFDEGMIESIDEMASFCNDAFRDYSILT